MIRPGRAIGAGAALSAAAWLVAVASGMALLLQGSGCASSRVHLDALPERPIAIVWWNYEDARKRAEQKQERAGKAGGPRREGVASAEGLAHLLGVERDSHRKFPGRMALLDPRSGDVTVMRQATPGAIPLAWSADGCCLLFSSTHRDGRQLFEWDREQGHVRQLTHVRGAVAHATYGPDGRVAFSVIAGREGQRTSRIWITKPDAASPRPLSEGPADHSPAWSPDGGSLVFVRDDPQSGSTLVARAPEPGAEEHLLGRGQHPVFTRAGDWIVYTGRTRDGTRLRRIRPDGSGKLPIGRSRFDERQPAVSPDGRYVVYVADENSHDRIYIRRLDGTGERVLLDDGDGSWPAW